MARTLTDEDVEAIAVRVVEFMGRRLVKADPQAQPPPEPKKKLPDKLTFTLNALGAELGISRATIYRLVARELIRPLPYFRRKVFARKEVERFLEGRNAR